MSYGFWPSHCYDVARPSRSEPSLKRPARSSRFARKARLSKYHGVERMVTEIFNSTFAALAVVAQPFKRKTSLTSQILAALDESKFDAWVDATCRPYAEPITHQSPNVLNKCFRAIVIELLIESRRIAGDSPLRLADVESHFGEFLSSAGGADRATGLTRLPLEVHRKVLAHTFEILAENGLIRGLPKPSNGEHERSPSLSGMVHKETGEDWICGSQPRVEPRHS